MGGGNDRELSSCLILQKTLLAVFFGPVAKVLEVARNTERRSIGAVQARGWSFHRPMPAWMAGN